MLFYMTSGKGKWPMSDEKREVLIFTPTPNEYEGVKKHLGDYKNFKARVVESGPGKINAAFKMTAEVRPLLTGGRRPLCLVGAGTSGSLNLGMSAGDIIISASCLISDWRMEDDSGRQHGPYGQFTYRPLSPQTVDDMLIDCPDPLVRKLADDLTGRGYKKGRLMTSDTFVAGRANKLAQGREFGCLACDMESGAFAFTAQNLLGGIPWFNLRVVADTLDENLSDYFNKEIDMVEILGQKTAEALTALDGLIGSERG